VQKIFRENRLANGSFVALGRELQLAKLTAPVFLLAGGNDEIVPPAQAMATASLLGTPPALIASEVVPSTHLGLFVGAQTLSPTLPLIAKWRSSEGSAKITSRAASA